MEMYKLSLIIIENVFPNSSIIEHCQSMLLSFEVYKQKFGHRFNTAEKVFVVREMAT